MNRALFRTVGWLLIALPCALVFPLAVALAHGEASSEVEAFVGAILFSLVSGAIMLIAFHGSAPRKISARDGAMTAITSWLAVGLISALPYLLSGVIPDPVDALFESLSGLTTTGASVLSDMDTIPRGVMFWRCMTQWLGGIGIIVLFVAILPSVGEGGYNLFRAEIPGGVNFEKVTPKIRQTARFLIKIYLLLTLLEFGLLFALGMSWYDALLHTFTTLSTGGFSPYTGSVGDVDSLAIRWAIILFMLIAGMNFTLHFHALNGMRDVYFKNAEWRLYLIFIGIAGLALSVSLLMNGVSGVTAITDGFFQAVSILTTTGFATADFTQWSPFSQLLLVTLMFVGGCAGSTAGSIKVVRLIMAGKAIMAELRRIVEPNEVIVSRLPGGILSEGDLRNALVFTCLFIATFIVGSLLVAMTGVEPVTAVTASIACLGNIGPGLGEVGPAGNFGGLPALAKLTLIAEMVAGRLELFGMLVFLTSAMRKK